MELSAPTAGALLPSGAEFALALTYPSDAPAVDRATSLTVELRSAAGELIATVALDAQALSQPTLPPITLPELEPGVYELHYRARSATGEVLNERRQLFISAEPIRITNLFVYPPVAEVRSQAIAQVELVFSAEHRPYVVWTLGSRRVAAGYLAGGLDGVALDTGSAAGVFQLTVQVFPFGPEEGADVSIVAPVRRAVELVVAEQRRLAATDYAPDDFTLLYSFAGNLRNSAATSLFAGAAYEARRIGSPQLQVRDDLFGYAVNEFDGIELPFSLLPGPDMQLFGRFRGFVADTEKAVEFFRSESAAGERLTFGAAEGFITLSYRATTAAAEQVQRLGPLPGRIIEGTLKIVRAGSELRIGWYSRGFSATVGVPRALDPAAVLAAHKADLIWLPGHVRLGAAPGPTVIWDEFGIQAPNAGLGFVRQSVTAALRQEFGDALLAAVVLPEAGEQHRFDLATHSPPPVLRIRRSGTSAGGFYLAWADESGEVIARVDVEGQQLQFERPEAALADDEQVTITAALAAEYFEVRWNGVDPRIAVADVDHPESDPLVIEFPATAFTPRTLIVGEEDHTSTGMMSAVLLRASPQ